MLGHLFVFSSLPCSHLHTRFSFLHFHSNGVSLLLLFVFARALGHRDLPVVSIAFFRFSLLLWRFAPLSRAHTHTHARKVFFLPVLPTPTREVFRFRFQFLVCSYLPQSAHIDRVILFPPHDVDGEGQGEGGRGGEYCCCCCCCCLVLCCPFRAEHIYSSSSF